MTGARTRAGWALVALALAGCPEVPRPDTVSSESATAPATAARRDEPEPPSTPGQRVELVDKAMGTRVTLAAYTTSTLGEHAIRAALAQGLAEIVRIEKLMSPWLPGSDVSRANAAAGKAPVTVSGETLQVLQKSLWIAERSQGTFDITFASMGKLWSFDEDPKRLVPDPTALEAARKKIDYRKVSVDPAAKTVKLEAASTRIDLGGIAKGYSIDRAAAVLRKAGLTSFFAQAGGDLYVEGRKPDGQPWKVGIRDPRGPEDAFFAALPVENHAFSTAGDYERAFIQDGKRYHHIIDPRTGYPATACRSVTVWAEDALTADAIDDAVFILGPTEGMALVESLDGAGAVIVSRDNQVLVSKRLEGVVKILHPPSDGI